MDNKILEIKLAIEAEEVVSLKEVEEIRVKYLGKSGMITALMKELGKLPNEEKPVVGKKINELRVFSEEKIKNLKENFEDLELEKKLADEWIDISLPVKRKKIGHKHPLNIILDKICEIFINMGFSVVHGPEIETDYYNFEALNIPQDHPARDSQDSFYITENVLLRTQTSPVQIRVMENQEPPIRIIAPGRVYRSDAVDSTHSPLFHQIEGLVVDKDVSMANLKGCLETFVKKLYGEKTKTRFRPHHFQFTEPSGEMDIACPKCDGAGCNVCKGEGWIEILGCGMVHRNVLKGVGIDPDIYSGFAFGLGLERIAMKDLGINDLRLFYENDIRFLEQF
ncbi:phenylalanine--tRNA ligase subunit alpha [Treponema sp. R6D11]